jgi:hypothetical protein
MTRVRRDLRSHLQLQGVFWDALKPDAKFAGVLSCDGRRIELQTFAELVTPDISFLITNPETVLDVVHGFTSEGECTLVGLQELSAPGLVDFPHNRAMRTRKYRVGACVIGWHLQSDTTPDISSASLRYSGISEWLPPRCSIAVTEEGSQVSFPAAPLTVLDVCVLANKTRVSIRVHQRPAYTPGGRDITARSNPSVAIEPAERKSLQWFVDSAYRFENFFSLCLGTSVRLNTVELTGTADQNGWLLLPRKGKEEKPDLQAWTRGDSSQLAAAVTAWLSTPEAFRPLENLIYGTIRHSSLFVETEFLSLAQALESFHRLTDNSRVVAPAFFKHALKALCRLISDQCGASPIAERFLDGIRHANDPSFKTRIHSLLSRMRSDHATRLLDDPATFEQALRQTRNHFTHPGIARKSKVITRTKELFQFNQRLHALLRLLMLLSIGFSEDSIFEAVYYQSRRWH